MGTAPAAGDDRDDDALPDGVDPACSHYARAQLDDLDGHVAAVVHGLTTRMPALAQLSAELRTQMIRWLARLSEAVMGVLLSGEDFDRLGPMIEAEARRRKQLGIDQSQTMNSARLGQQALLEHARGYFRGHPLEVEMMAQIVPRLMEFQHVMTTSVWRGYAADTEPEDPTDRQAQLQVLLDLLTGRLTGEGSPDAAGLAARLGVELPPRLATVSRVLDDAADQARSVARMNRWAAVGVSGGRVVALSLRAPNAFPAPRGSAAVPADSSAIEVDHALSVAGAAAEVAGRLGATELTYAQAAPFAAVLALPEADRAAYISSCFGALPDTQRGRSLLLTAGAALTSNRLSEAAAALHVHRHTLDYRLRRLHEQTGLDLADPAAKLRCMIGLFLLDLLPPPISASA